MKNEWNNFWILKIHKCVKQKIRVTSNPITQREHRSSVWYLLSKSFPVALCVSSRTCAFARVHVWVCTQIHRVCVYFLLSKIKVFVRSFLSKCRMHYFNGYMIVHVGMYNDLISFLSTNIQFISTCSLL